MHRLASLRSGRVLWFPGGCFEVFLSAPSLFCGCALRRWRRKQGRSVHAKPVDATSDGHSGEVLMQLLWDGFEGRRRRSGVLLRLDVRRGGGSGVGGVRGLAPSDVPQSRRRRCVRWPTREDRKAIFAMVPFQSMGFSSVSSRLRPMARETGGATASSQGSSRLLFVFPFCEGCLCKFAVQLCFGFLRPACAWLVLGHLHLLSKMIRYPSMLLSLSAQTYRKKILGERPRQQPWRERT